MQHGILIRSLAEQGSEEAGTAPPLCPGFYVGLPTWVRCRPPGLGCVGLDWLLSCLRLTSSCFVVLVGPPHPAPQSVSTLGFKKLKSMALYSEF